MIHDNPDVAYYKVRIDSFGPNGEEGLQPSTHQIEAELMAALDERFKFQNTEFFVTVDIDAG